MHMLHIVIFVLLPSRKYFHIISYKVRFYKKVIGHKMSFDFLYNICLQYFSF